MKLENVYIGYIILFSLSFYMFKHFPMIKVFKKWIDHLDNEKTIRYIQVAHCKITCLNSSKCQHPKRLK